MDSQSEMLLELMSVLGHERFAVVAHDQGGAAAQIIAARQPERLTAMVLTDCVCYDNWPVAVIATLQRLVQLPGVKRLVSNASLMAWLETRTPLSAFRRGVHGKPIAPAVIREYLRPLREGKARREAFISFLLAGSPRYTEVTVPALRRFEQPTFVIWAADDRYLSPSWGLRLKEDIPGARRFELIPFCGHFWQEERPAEFASHIGAFLAEHLLATAVSEAPAVSPATPDHEAADGRHAVVPCRATDRPRPKRRPTPSVAGGNAPG